MALLTDGKRVLLGHCFGGVGGISKSDLCETSLAERSDSDE